MFDYSDKVKEYFFQPRNAGVLEDANAVGEAGSLAGGDALKLMLRINPLSEMIEEARFLSHGGGSMIACSSALTELVRGKSVDAASRLTPADIAEFLDGLPPEKMHCTESGAKALAAAIAAFRGETPVAPERRPAQPALVTIAVPPKPRRAAPPAAAAMAARQAGAAPGMTLRELIAKNNPLAAMAEAEETGPVEPVSETDAEAISRIITEMRPVFQRDKGDIELLDIKGRQVFVRLSGTCASCMMASQTLAGVQKRIMETLGRPFRLIPSTARA
ncbi:iron-sulfur cluster assembly scaffold protein [Rhodobacter maris]|uniref:Nitrogen fixation protein NifU n=1 Tax=Rhodobacter maris TaxID=446682 RepID=A0A285SJ02_9RHOB|nr:iron-sulfur cluster assembly scaffold protein [Rhodobacter maris]SOC07922.1 modular FeS cluster scaffolding protein NifU [Rhodobacter maris]